MTAVAILNSVSLFRGCSEVICIKHSTRSLASEKRSPGVAAFDFATNLLGDFVHVSFSVSLLL